MINIGPPLHHKTCVVQDPREEQERRLEHGEVEPRALPSQAPVPDDAERRRQVVAKRREVLVLVREAIEADPEEPFQLQDAPDFAANAHRDGGVVAVVDGDDALRLGARAPRPVVDGLLKARQRRSIARRKRRSARRRR